MTANAVLLGNGTSALQTVAPSTSGNVLTSNGTTWTSAALPASGLGIGQTWQTPSRALNTTYTNSTGKPIAVAAGASNYQGDLLIYVDSVLVSRGYGSYDNGEPSVYAIVPNGSSYQITGSKLNYWSELR